MAGIALGVAETAVCWAFPQLGVVVKSARYTHAVYNVVKISASVFTGDAVGVASGIGAIALAAAKTITCEEKEAICVKTCHAFNGGVDAGACLVGCKLAYWACKQMN